MLVLLLACAPVDGREPPVAADDTGGSDTDTVPVETGDTDTGPGDTDTGPGDTDTGPGDTDTAPNDTGADPDDTDPDDTGPYEPDTGSTVTCDDTGTPRSPAWTSGDIAAVADAWFVPELGVGWTGASVALDDLDDDGRADVVILAGDPGGDGVVYVQPAPAAGENLLASAALTITSDRDRPYTAYAEDLDGDGVSDLVYGAPIYGTLHRPSGAWLFSGPCAGGCTGELTTDDAALRVEEDGEDLYAGVLVGGGDLDGDGIREVLVNSPSAGESIHASGRVYALPATATGTATAASDATTVVHGDFRSERAGEAFAVDDLDGDGFDDLVLGAANRAVSDGDSGAVYVVFGPRSGWVSTADADAVRYASGTAYLGDAVATGDVNGDGVPDLVASASRGSRVGAWAFFGPVAGEDTLDAADVRLTPPSTAWRFGSSLAVGDFDGDERDDIVVGDLYDSAGGEYAGAVQLWWSPAAGTAAADLTWTGAAGERLGDGLGVGDVDGDCRDDLLVGPLAMGSRARDEVWLLYGR